VKMEADGSRPRTYERFMDLTVSRDVNITNGQVYWSVLRRRRGDLGICVQIILT
jgi:CTP synthase